MEEEWFAPDAGWLHVRHRRQAGRDRRRDVLQLEPHEVGVTMGFDKNQRYQKMIEAVPPDRTDRDFTNMTVEEIVEALDAALSLFEGNLGNIHATEPTIRLRELTGPEQVKHLQPKGLTAATHRICELSLPANFGLALSVEDQFKMLGLYDPVQHVKKPDKTNVFGGAEYGSVYLMGEAKNGKKHTVFTGSIPLRRGTRGETLLINRYIVKKKSKDDITKKQLTLAPRLVLVPSELEWAVDLRGYSPALKGTLQSFVLLHDLLMETACEVFGFASRPFDLDSARNNKFPVLIPCFDGARSCASFFIEVVFGSQAVADVFAISGQAPLPLTWSTATALPDQNFITFFEEKDFTEEALDQWPTTTDNLMTCIVKPGTKADRDLLRLHWGNIVSGKTSYMDMTARGDSLPPYLENIKIIYETQPPKLPPQPAPDVEEAPPPPQPQPPAPDAAGGARPRLPVIPEERGEDDDDDDAEEEGRRRLAEEARKRLERERQEAEAKKMAEAREKLRLYNERLRQEAEQRAAEEQAALEEEQRAAQELLARQQQEAQRRQQEADAAAVQQQAAANAAAAAAAVQHQANIDALNRAWQAQQALVPPPPAENQIVRRVPNCEPAPPRTFVYFQSATATARCPGAQLDANTNFPRRFYLMSEDGERRDYIAHYGPASVAGCFSNEDSGDPDDARLLEEGPLSEGFVLDSFTSGERTLRFQILSSDLTVFRNTLNRDAFVRGTFSVLKLSPTMHNPLF